MPKTLDICTLCNYVIDNQLVDEGVNKQENPRVGCKNGYWSLLTNA